MACDCRSLTGAYRSGYAPRDMTASEIFVLGGPNGAGKSTTATVLLPEALSIEQFVNADLIAQGISPFAPATGVIEAGRVMHRRVHDLRDRRQSFAFETTLASRSYVSFLADAQQVGFIVHLAFGHTACSIPCCHSGSAGWARRSV